MEGALSDEPELFELEDPVELEDDRCFALAPLELWVAVLVALAEL